MAKRIHIFVVEPSPIIRCGIVTLLQGASVPNIIVAESADMSSISIQSQSDKPDLLIVNPSSISTDSSSHLKRMMGNENLKTVALQSALMDNSRLACYDAVISIYDSMDAIKEKIVTLIHVNEDVDEKRELSIREKEVIVCVVKGMTNKQIADTLVISTHTVIAHRRNIANKLQIHSPSGLTIYAIVNKLVDLSEVKNSISQSRDAEV